MTRLDVLTDIEFEALVRDLLVAQMGRPVERFSRARDGGVDLRWVVDPELLGIGQCKHYLRSTFSQLNAAARYEESQLAAIQPADYRFITSFPLSKTQKDQIRTTFGSWMTGPEQVLGREDVEGLVALHPHVERRHPKLWLSTGTQLFWATHSELLNRSAALHDRIEDSLRRYVVNGSYGEAQALLEEKRVCIIAGVPGIGKTMLAHVLLADAALADYEPVEISEDVAEGWAAFDEEVRQIFLYDDFLGELSFAERLGKNEDRRLAAFIEKIASSPGKRLVLTTREYVLRDARQKYEGLRRLGEQMDFVLELKDYQRIDRASILYTHLWHGDLSSTALGEVAEGGYKPIIDHPSYSPRLIEYCTGRAFDTSSGGYVERFVNLLDHPHELWRTAFEEHLPFEQQVLVVTLVAFGPAVRVESLRAAYHSFCSNLGRTVSAADFRRHLGASEGTFVEIFEDRHEPHVRYHNPSVREFVLDWLAADAALTKSIVESALFFEQLERLILHGTGSARGWQDSAPRPALLEILRSMTPLLERRFADLVDSDAPEQVFQLTKDEGLIAEPREVSKEARLRFLVALEPDLRPSDSWLASQIESVAYFWRFGEGNKQLAAYLLEELDEHKIQIPDEIRLSAGSSLNAFLRSSLDETEADWGPLMYRSRGAAGAEFNDDSTLAAEFEQHARSELDSWSLPPAAEELEEFAREFGFENLAAEIQAAIEESRSRAEAEEGAGRPMSNRMTERPQSDAKESREIGSMFRRLGQQ
ncbi:hypothetical protein [Ilumatobacter sp.]|uniref:nSTAND3 domain-containing NTPase n=1 Tax=Ilumatobacter sp. TaxID=1967498 RepID=UPI003752BAC1